MLLALFALCSGGVQRLALAYLYRLEIAFNDTTATRKSKTSLHENEFSTLGLRINLQVASIIIHMLEAIFASINLVPTIRLNKLGKLL